MPKEYIYYVELPFAGSVTCEVRNDRYLTEKQAIDLALKEYTFHRDDINELKIFRKIMDRNVFYGPVNEANVFDTEIDTYGEEK